MTKQLDRLPPTTIEGIKRLAKKLRKRDGLQHCVALDAAAMQAGFADYRHAQTQISSIGPSSLQNAEVTAP